MNKYTALATLIAVSERIRERAIALGDETLVDLCETQDGLLAELSQHVGDVDFE